MIGLTEPANANTKPTGVAGRDFVSWSQLQHFGSARFE